MHISAVSATLEPSQIQIQIQNQQEGKWAALLEQLYRELEKIVESLLVWRRQ